MRKIVTQIRAKYGKKYGLKPILMICFIKFRCVYVKAEISLMVRDSFVIRRLVLLIDKRLTTFIK